MQLISSFPIISVLILWLGMSFSLLAICYVTGKLLVWLYPQIFLPILQDYFLYSNVYGLGAVVFLCLGMIGGILGMIYAFILKIIACYNSCKIPYTIEEIQIINSHNKEYKIHNLVDYICFLEHILEYPCSWKEDKYI